MCVHRPIRTFTSGQRLLAKIIQQGEKWTEGVDKRIFNSCPFSAFMQFVRDFIRTELPSISTENVKLLLKVVLPKKQ